MDERYSTTEARTRTPGDRDAASACIILEQFLGFNERIALVHGALMLDAQALYLQLRRALGQLLRPCLHLVGILSPRAALWLARSPCSRTWYSWFINVISSALHRDDFSKRGMASSAAQTRLDFVLMAQHVILLR